MVNLQAKKLFILTTNTDQEWKSYDPITRNLKSCYHLLNCPKKFFEISQKPSNQEFDLLCNDFSSFLPDVFAVATFQPHPLLYLKHLSKIPSFKKVKILFHLCGDFSLFTELWKMTEVYLKGHQIHWVVASSAQKSLVDKLIKEKASVHVIPFPVNPDSFYFSQSERDETRKSFGLKKDNLVFMYSGRLSYQKNIHHLITWFSLTSPMSHLLIAGEIDDIGFPEFHGFQKLGEQKELIDFTLRKYPDIKSRVLFTGNLKPESLRKHLNAADIFISFSLHHDEDFGLSVAEAGLCGLPLILSRWAGYKDFEKNLRNVVAIPVQKTIKGPGHLDDYGNLLNRLSEVSEPGLEECRQQREQQTKKLYAIENISAQIQILLKTPFLNFLGFTEEQKSLVRFRFKKAKFDQSEKDFRLYNFLYEGYY